MNEKKAKALRRAIRADGFVPAPILMRYSTNVSELQFSLPLTFRYPANSFQRVYHDMKRAA